MKQPIARLVARSVAAVVSLLCLLSGVTETAHGRKPVPPPCAADGTCIPNRVNWGHYRTNWNRWPGDAGAVPTPVDEDLTSEDDELPDGPITPESRQEDQRGPERPPSELDGAAGNATVPSPDGPVNMAPDAVPDAAPGGILPDVEQPEVDENDSIFDPFGRNEQLPSTPSTAADQVRQAGAVAEPPQHVEPEPTLNDILEQQQQDAPPSLPPSLMRAVGHLPARSADPRKSGVAGRNLPSTDLPLAQPTRLQVVGAQHSHTRPSAPPIQQATWTDDDGMHVVNPASVAATDQPAQGVQQAIYIEASDQ